ncbi:hypothetical protein BD770DRAFT_376329 [Pilaira anomala]|nr:hypothetical protein BD770DRAFT_376329 [Pilaira anomala]
MLVSLQHVIDANSREIEKLKKESAELCLSIKNNVNRYHESLGHLLDNLNKCKKDTITKELKSSLDTLNTSVSEFYDKEYLKCCHSVSNSHFESSFQEEAGDNENNIILSTEELLDKRIKFYEYILSQNHQ